MSQHLTSKFIWTKMPKIPKGVLVQGPRGELYTGGILDPHISPVSTLQSDSRQNSLLTLTCISDISPSAFVSKPLHRPDRHLIYWCPALFSQGYPLMDAYISIIMYPGALYSW